MNQAQRNHFNKRVYEILKTKLVELEDQFTEEAKELTRFERFDLVKNKKVNFIKGLDSLGPHDEVREIWDFSKYEHSERIKDKKTYEAKRRALQKRAGQIQDQIQVVDAPDAASLIKTFENEPVQ